MRKKITITVEVDDSRKEITLQDDTGTKRDLKSILVTGGGCEEGSFYLFGWGSCADLGWTLAEGYRYSRLSSRPQDRFYRRVFAHLIRWIAQFHGWTLEQSIDPQTLLERWEAEDTAKSVEEAEQKKMN
jgi:hypothetical protein